MLQGCYSLAMNDCLEENVRGEPLSGNEEFRGDGQGSSLRVIDYWKWSGSNLMDNTSRGVVAEFLVATAIGLHRKPRVEWERYDLELRPGVTIEVKSSAYYQSWDQEQRSTVEFAIGRRKRWRAEKRRWSKERARWANLYVFCVLEGCDPLDTNNWEFLVLPTAELEKDHGESTRIRLRPLKELKPEACRYPDLKVVIERKAQEIQD